MFIETRIQDFSAEKCVHLEKLKHLKYIKIKNERSNAYPNHNSKVRMVRTKHHHALKTHVLGKTKTLKIHQNKNKHSNPCPDHNSKVGMFRTKHHIARKKLIEVTFIYKIYRYFRWLDNS